MHDLQTDQNHQRVERIVRRSTRPHHQLDRWNMNMNKILVTFAVALALAGCAKQPTQSTAHCMPQQPCSAEDFKKLNADPVAKAAAVHAFQVYAARPEAMEALRKIDKQPVIVM